MKKYFLLSIMLYNFSLYYAAHSYKSAAIFLIVCGFMLSIINLKINRVIVIKCCLIYILQMIIILAMGLISYNYYVILFCIFSSISVVSFNNEYLNLTINLRLKVKQLIEVWVGIMFFLIIFMVLFLHQYIPDFYSTIFLNGANGVIQLITLVYLPLISYILFNCMKYSIKVILTRFYIRNKSLDKYQKEVVSNVLK
ncbi:MAG: hypothetical protein ACK5KQ_02990 [Anaerorhabdus sp.]